MLFDTISYPLLNIHSFYILVYLTKNLSKGCATETFKDLHLKIPILMERKMKLEINYRNEYISINYIISDIFFVSVSSKINCDIEIF